MIDFHCHLDLYPKAQDVATECHNRALFVLSVTTTPSAWPVTTGLAHHTKSIHTALGLHPQLAAERRSELSLFDEYLPKTRFVGEIGLDGAPEHRASWQHQVKVFEYILRACRSAGGRVLSVHSRRAATEVLERVREVSDSVTVVLHWFSGSRRELDRAVELGCWFSVGPAMLASKKGAALAARMPREKVLTESDGPFAQWEGRCLFPWNVDAAISLLGRVWNLTPQQTDGIVQDNLDQLLRFAQPPEVFGATHRPPGDSTAARE